MEEHVRFLKGLQVFGPVWKHVAYVVRTRPANQVQTHGNSYMTRQKKNGHRVKRSIHDMTLEHLRETEERLRTDSGCVWDTSHLSADESLPVSTERKKKKSGKR
jgi:hypothetical protein